MDYYFYFHLFFITFHDSISFLATFHGVVIVHEVTKQRIGTDVKQSCDIIVI